jgi:hypothetical protein
MKHLKDRKQFESKKYPDIDRSQLLATLIFTKTEREIEGLINYMKYKYPDINFLIGKDDKYFGLYTDPKLDDEKYKEVFQHLANTGTTVVDKYHYYGRPKA